MTLNVSGRSFGEELAAYLTLLRDLPDMRDLSCTRVVVVENDFLSAEETEPPSFDVSARGAAHSNRGLSKYSPRRLADGST